MQSKEKYQLQWQISIAKTSFGENKNTITKIRNGKQKIILLAFMKYSFLLNCLNKSSLKLNFAIVIAIEFYN